MGRARGLHFDEQDQVVEDDEPVNAASLVPVDDLGVHLGIGKLAELASYILLEEVPEFPGEVVPEVVDAHVVQTERAALGTDQVG